MYALILENKNSLLYERILPVLGGFHTASAFLSVIYCKLKGFGLKDLSVVAVMIEPGSVDDAIKGGHYQIEMRIHKLIHESLVRILIEQGESSEISRSIKAKLQNSFVFKKIFDEDEQTAKKINELMSSYFNKIDMESPMVSFWYPLLALSFNVRSKLVRVLTLKILMIPWMSAYDSMHYGH